MADRLTVAERVQAVEHLGRIAETLNEAAVWLGNLDAFAPAELAEQAAEKLAAAAWILQAPIRGGEPGLLAAQTLAAGNGRPSLAPSDGR
jgi:hypothetical protein